jgi:hypothetical protein
LNVCFGERGQWREVEGLQAFVERQSGLDLMAHQPTLSSLGHFQIEQRGE